MGAQVGEGMTRPREVHEGRYELRERIGRGSGGEVYRAIDRQDGSICAVKMHPPSGEAARRLRFLAESDVLSRIDHPHVVRMLAAGEQDGWLWFAMDLLPGGCLRQYIEEQGPVSVEEACRLMLQVLLGLQTVHRAGLVHRDVKPHNVYLDDKGRAVLGDFGIVRQLRDAPFRTQQGASLGTPGYRAPEQVTEAEQADRRADIYGAGATLYFIATDVRPEYLHGARRFYPQALEPLPDALEPIVMKACAYEPAERYPDAASMARDLIALRDRLLAERGEPQEAELWAERFTYVPTLRERVARWFLPDLRR